MYLNCTFELTRCWASLRSFPRLWGRVSPHVCTPNFMRRGEVEITITFSVILLNLTTSRLIQSQNGEHQTPYHCYVLDSKWHWCTGVVQLLVYCMSQIKKNVKILISPKIGKINWSSRDDKLACSDLTWVSDIWPGNHLRQFERNLPIYPSIHFALYPSPMPDVVSAHIKLL